MVLWEFTYSSYSWIFELHCSWSFLWTHQDELCKLILVLWESTGFLIQYRVTIWGVSAETGTDTNVSHLQHMSLVYEAIISEHASPSFVWWMYECIPHRSCFGLFPSSSITQYKYDLKNKLAQFQPGSHLEQSRLSTAHCRWKGDPPSHTDKQEVGTYIHSLLHPLKHSYTWYLGVLGRLFHEVL